MCGSLKHGQKEENIKKQGSCVCSSRPKKKHPNEPFVCMRVLLTNIRHAHGRGVLGRSEIIQKHAIYHHSTPPLRRKRGAGGRRAAART
eukprot:545092-Pleurochrysis_carterae.AAC.1